MLALGAALCFLLVLLGVHASFSLTTLGFLLMALHLAFSVPIPWRRG